LNENVKETNNDKDRIHCVDLYNIFKKWFIFKDKDNKIPSDKNFVQNLRKYKIVEEDLRIDNKVRRGIKNNKIIDGCQFF
jgi:hypothetical protein